MSSAVQSAIIGATLVKSRFAAYEEAVKLRLAEAVVTAAQQMQADLVATAPIKDGDLKAALASSDAVRVSSPGTSRVRAQVGFLTREQKKRAFHAFFVEFGTKGYVKGEKRFAGVARRTGRRKMQKVKRNIPARPAHPFFRPAYIRLKRNLEILRAEAHARALADVFVGRTGSDRLLG